jgi:hypothetical protein
MKSEEHDTFARIQVRIFLSLILNVNGSVRDIDRSVCGGQCWAHGAQAASGISRCDRSPDEPGKSPGADLRR